jgi:hypothetical protein
MTNEELDEATAKEAYELWCRDQPDGTKGYAPVQVAIRAARLAREGWTPPEPAVDPDILAFREWGERRFGVNTASAYRLGDCDDTAIADAYLAGARMAREQERERAGPLVEFVEDHSRRLDGVGARAHDILAKYRGEA